MKNLLSKIYFLFKTYSFVEVVYLLIRFNKTKFFQGNTNNTNKNGVNKQNTHTHTHILNTLGKITLEQGCPAMSLAASKFCLFSDSAKEASSDVTTILNLRFITTPKPAPFQKILRVKELQVKKVLLNLLNFTDFLQKIVLSRT